MSLYLLMYYSYIVDTVIYALKGEATDYRSIARYAVSFRLYLGNLQSRLTFVTLTCALTN